MIDWSRLAHDADLNAVFEDPESPVRKRLDAVERMLLNDATSDDKMRAHQVGFRAGVLFVVDSILSMAQGTQATTETASAPSRLRRGVSRTHLRG